MRFQFLLITSRDGAFEVNVRWSEVKWIDGWMDGWMVDSPARLRKREKKGETYSRQSMRTKDRKRS